MCNCFTDGARRVMQLADREARRLKHSHIGTEHILLGMVEEDGGLVVNVLERLDVDLRKVQLGVSKLVPRGTNMISMEKLPFTTRARKVVELATEESHLLCHNYVGTGHILLGLLREEEAVAVQVLLELGIKLEEIREEVLEILRSGLETLHIAEDSGIGRTLECQVFTILGGCVVSDRITTQSEINRLLTCGIEVENIFQSSTADQTHITIFYRKKR